MSLPLPAKRSRSPPAKAAKAAKRAKPAKPTHAPLPRCDCGSHWPAAPDMPVKRYTDVAILDVWKHIAGFLPPSSAMSLFGTFPWETKWLSERATKAFLMDLPPSVKVSDEKGAGPPPGPKGRKPPRFLPSSKTSQFIDASIAGDAPFMAALLAVPRPIHGPFLLAMLATAVSTHNAEQVKKLVRRVTQEACDRMDPADLEAFIGRNTPAKPLFKKKMDHLSRLLTLIQLSARKQLERAAKAEAKRKKVANLSEPERLKYEQREANRLEKARLVSARLDAAQAELDSRLAHRLAALSAAPPGGPAISPVGLLAGHGYGFWGCCADQGPPLPAACEEFAVAAPVACEAFAAAAPVACEAFAAAASDACEAFAAVGASAAPVACESFAEASAAQEVAAVSSAPVGRKEPLKIIPAPGNTRERSSVVSASLASLIARLKTTDPLTVSDLQ